MSDRSRSQPVPELSVTSSAAPVSGYPIRRIPAPESLLQLDGSVVIPPAVAGHVLRALVRDLTARVAADGGRLAPGVQRVLYALHEAAQQPEGSVAGTPDRPEGTVELTARQVATLLECSPEYARRLARSGRVHARRAGPVWLVDADSVDAYRTGRTPCPPDSTTSGPPAATT